MKCRKQLVLTGYLVRHVDLREAKPRSVKEDVYVLDKDALAALGLLGLNVVDFITTRYEHVGYHVIGIEPIKPKRVAEVDLCRLWQTEVNSEVLANE